MSAIVAAEGAVLDEILDASFGIWSDGLSRENYAKYNAAQMRTPWGRAHLDRVALLRDGRVVSSLKRYRFSARLGGTVLPALGLGAVFTQPDARGQGAAAEIIDRVLEDASRDGIPLALLFSEIGAPYYERRGFVEVPREELTLEVERRPGAPAVLVRAAEERDIHAIAALLRDRSARAAFALETDEDLVRYSVSKKRLLAGLGAPGARAVEFHIAEEGASAVAFVLVTRSAHGRTLEACGDRDPSGARVGAILQVLDAREPAEEASPMAAWLPAGFRPPQLRVADRRPAAQILMFKPLAPGIDVSGLDASNIAFWHADVF